MESLGLLRHLEQGVRDEFSVTRRVMCFDEYFELFCSEPVRHTRTAAHYLRDCMAYYGRVEMKRPEGKVYRHQLFDRPFDGGRDRLVGQETAAGDLLRVLNNFVRDGRVTRLVMVHGPNGSGKSTFIQALGRALEHYSTTEEGAIHAFSWVFPSSRVSKKKLGFAGHGSKAEPLKSFAELEEEDIDAVLPGDLRDHPMLLLPRTRRWELFEKLRGQGRLSDDQAIGEYLSAGDLSPRSRAVFDALLASYAGDIQRVLQHVRVERFFFSRRYRIGAVTIEPQLHVDASSRQVTADQGLQSLPPSLKNLNLFEPQGDLVDGNRGLVEYNDLLKKPVDAFKYLLATCEKGTVALPNAILHLDAVFLATSNEKHLSAFKQYQDFPSFKARLDLVRMPYLRDYTVEQRVLDDVIQAQDLESVTAPHATNALALWAVLTRLRRPVPAAYTEQIRSVVEDMTPLEKANLYAGESMPEGLTAEQVRELRAVIPALLSEGHDEPDYEGSFGASPREVKQVLLNALQSEKHWGLSALAVFEELRALVNMKSVYEFLQREPEGGYHEHESFIDQAFDRYLTLVDADVQAAMGMVGEGQYEQLFGRYILHVSYLLKGERVLNETTGKYEDPDAKLIERLEGIWEVQGGTETFRRDLISRIGAWRIDNPGEELPYRELFSELFQALERDYHRKHVDTIRKQCEHVLRVMRQQDVDDEAARPAGSLSKAESEAAKRTIDRLGADFGYPREIIREAVSVLLRERY